MRTIPAAPTWFMMLITFLMWGCHSDHASSASLASSDPDIVAVAAASDLKFAFDELIREFESRYPHIRVQPTYGSSGNLYAQLTNQAPFDLFLSADIEFPHRLIAQGDADQQTEFLYAIGRVALWARNESPVDVEALRFNALLAPEVRTIAIANPQHAPYGKAAVAALQSLGLYDQVESKLVYGENVTQAAQFVESGAADIGIISLSLALAPSLRETGCYWLFPDDACPPLEQGGVILNRAKNRQSTEALRMFMLSPTGREILGRYGFQIPTE